MAYYNRPNGYPRPRSHEDEFFVPGPDVFSHPSQQFRQALNPDPDSFRFVKNSLHGMSSVFPSFIKVTG